MGVNIALTILSLPWLSRRLEHRCRLWPRRQREKYVFTMALYCFFASLTSGRIKKLGQNIHRKRDPAVNHRNRYYCRSEYERQSRKSFTLGTDMLSLLLGFVVRVRGKRGIPLCLSKIDKNQATSSQLTNHRKQVRVVYRLFIGMSFFQSWSIQMPATAKPK